MNAHFTVVCDERERVERESERCGMRWEREKCNKILEAWGLPTWKRVQKILNILVTNNSTYDWTHNSGLRWERSIYI